MVRDRFPERQNMNLLFDSDIVNLLLKTSRVRNRRPSCYFCNLECFNCQWVGCGDVGQKNLFRAG